MSASVTTNITLQRILTFIDQVKLQPMRVLFPDSLRCAVTYGNKHSRLEIVRKVEEPRCLVYIEVAVDV